MIHRLLFTSDVCLETFWRIFSAVSFAGNIFSSSVGKIFGGIVSAETDPSTDAFSYESISAAFVVMTVSVAFCVVNVAVAVVVVVSVDFCSSDSGTLAADKSTANRNKN